MKGLPAADQVPPPPLVGFGVGFGVEGGEFSAFEREAQAHLRLHFPLQWETMWSSSAVPTGVVRLCSASFQLASAPRPRLALQLWSLVAHGPFRFPFGWHPQSGSRIAFPSSIASELILLRVVLRRSYSRLRMGCGASSRQQIRQVHTRDPLRCNAKTSLRLRDRSVQVDHARSGTRGSY